MQVESGGEVIGLSAEAKATFDTLGQQVVDRWVAESTKSGFDGAALVAAARASIAKYSK